VLINEIRLGSLTITLDVMQTMKKMGLIALSMLTGLAALGHSDPMGEVHPVVTINEGHFRVGFRISYTRDEGWNERYLNRVFVRDYDLKGKTLNERKEITGKPESEEFKLDKSHFDTEYKLPDNWNIWRVVALDDERSALLSYRSTEDPNLIEDIFRINPTTALEELEQIAQELMLFIVNKSDGKVITKHKLGAYRDVAYGFPAVSNIVACEDMLYMVWNQSNGWKYEESMEDTLIDPFAKPKPNQSMLTKKELIRRKVHNPATMTLTTYNIQTDTLESRELTYPSHWNTSIAIGLIENKLCLAYHGLSETLSVNVLNLPQHEQLGHN